MTINFPNTPIVGDEYTYLDVTYKFTNSGGAGYWKAITIAGGGSSAPASHVGMIIQTFSASTPNALGYEGTWTQLAAEVSIISGVGPNATPAGTNTPAVPLLEHGHTITVNGAGNIPLRGGSNADVANHGVGGGLGGWNIAPIAEQGNNAPWSLYIADHAHTAGAGVAGVPSPTIDTRGLFVVAVTWHRTA